MDNCAIKFSNHFIILLLLVMALFLFTACSSGENSQTYEVEYNGKVITVDQVNQTITVDGHICKFEVTGGGNNMDFDVTYPDGSTYWWSETGNIGSGGWSVDYDPDRYAPGDVLWTALSLSRPSADNDTGKYIGLGILLILFGVVNVADPRTMWYLSYGWRYKNAEPSDLALFAGRAGGVITIISGVICLFI